MASIVRSSLCSAVPTKVCTASVMCLVTCVGCSGKLHDALVAKLRVIDVLGFVQTVCEEEDGRRLLQRDLLLLEIEVGDDTDGQVTVAGQQGDAAVHEQRSVVTGIAVAQLTRLQVECAHEECHEHIGVVALRLCLIQGIHDACGFRYVL